MSRMEFILCGKDGDHAIAFQYDRLFAIGYAGRDTAKTLEHIRELEEQLGVPAPKRLPTIFQCGTYLLTQERELDFSGSQTCGEAEYVMLTDGEKLYIGLGSDHTDREMESQSVLKSKQVCAKPIGRILWDYEDLKDHWDEIRITSWQVLDGEKTLYQRGTLADIMEPERLLQELGERTGDIRHAVIYSGTVPLIDGFKYGTEFICELDDEKLGRKLTLSYKVRAVEQEM